MLLPSVSETLASVSRHPALEAAISALRRGVAHEHVSGLTDTAKALVAAFVAAEHRRPVVVLVTSGARAETLAASLEFFYRALAGQEATEVAVFPALDALPWQEVSSHAEILETRAVTLWRYTSGLARVVVAPIAAARMRLADAASYAGQARTLARDQEVLLDEFVAHLRRVGYESHDMVEMPGQFTVRGGIVDVFPAEAERPVRLELFGDSVESLREFDPNTQRSVRPIERVTLPPLLEQPANGSRFSDGNSGGPTVPLRAHSLFDLREETIVILDEPEAIDEAAKEFFANAEESLQDAGDSAPDSVDDAIASHFFTGDWDRQLSRHARLELDHLVVTREGIETRTMQTQSTTRYHGNVPAFMAEARERIAAGERVLLAAGNLGELERFVDLCHEYEVPYRLGEIEENVTSARLSEASSRGSVAAIVLAPAPVVEGVILPDAHLTIYGTGDLFEPQPTGAASRRRVSNRS